MQFSSWSNRIQNESGIINLMKDLGNAAPRKDQPLYMLGGGAPAKIPEVEQYIRKQMEELMAEGREFENLVSEYAGPQGSARFVESLAALFRKNFGWDIGPENIATANGSQMAFTILFRFFAGEFGHEKRKKILLPMTPEYIGYSEAEEAFHRFRSYRPRIDRTSENTFKYEIDFDQIEVQDDIGAICISRPTNPTGNVVTDEEVDRLSKLARDHDIPLIIDGAYGLPFPNMVYTDASLKWNENIILSLSLSKIGLPGARTGIVIARPDIIELFTCANAVLTLASGNFGARLLLESVRSGKILEISKRIVQPFYKNALDFTVDTIHSKFKDIPYVLHNPEGAFFVWLWFPDLPISNDLLYERLKDRNVYIVPGIHFFPGLEERWQHRYECLRLSYAGSEQTIENGLEIMAEEVSRAYQANPSISLRAPMR